METVVYILGAGFSAPLGLPVMNNFLEKAKDLYFRDTAKYSYFDEVFKQIDQLHKIKGVFKSDLFNIEEILSILEMKSSLITEFNEELFIRFISEVIAAYTPAYKPPPDLFSKPQEWPFSVYRTQDKWNNYLRFTYALFNLKLTHVFDPVTNRMGDFIFESSEVTTKYSVITLNYDIVLEMAIERLLQCTHGNRSHKKPKFQKKLQETAGIDNFAVSLAKLHGSIDSNDIIPPTWSKSLDPKVKDAWCVAYNVLSKANHIRILGYSLPTSDSYVRYLLKSAILENPHLKSIDVICKSGSVKDNYDKFIQFHKYRYFDVDIKDYLDPYTGTKFQSDPVLNMNKFLQFQFLEELHEWFVKERGGQS